MKTKSEKWYQAQAGRKVRNQAIKLWEKRLDTYAEDLDTLETEDPKHPLRSTDRARAQLAALEH